MDMYAGPTPLIGRERDLETLLGYLQVARGGRGGVVLIDGEPGIGKTRLASELAARASETGCTVLRGHAYEMRGMPPYLPFVEILNQHRQSADADLLDGQIQAVPGVLPLLPDIRERYADVATPSPEPEAERYELFEAVANFLIRMATDADGLLLCIDDLHWADGAALQLFLHVARRIGSAPILIIATYRGLEIDEAHPLFEVLAELRRERLATLLQPAPLTLGQVGDLAAALNQGAAVAQEVASALLVLTNGNPFFAEEMVQHLLAEGFDLADAGTAKRDWGVPEGLKQVTGRRLARMSQDVNEILEAAAILGDGFRFDVLAAMSGRPGDELLALLDEASRAGVLHDAGDGYRFGHPLIRETLYQRSRTPRRQQLHAEAVRAIESVFAANLDTHVAALAMHCRLAGRSIDTAKTIDYLYRAGSQALQAIASEEAIAALGHALRLLDGIGGEIGRRADVLHQLAIAYFRAEPDLINSSRLAGESAELYEAAGDIDSAIDLLLMASRSLTAPRASFDLRKALSHLRHAEALATRGDPSRMCRVLTEKAYAAAQAMRLSEMAEAVDAALELAQRLGDRDLLGNVLEVAPFHYFAEARVQDALDASESAMAIDTRHYSRLWHTTEVAGFCAWEYLADIPLVKQWEERKGVEWPDLPRLTITLAYVSGGELAEAEAHLQRMGRGIAPDDWLLEYWRCDAAEDVESILEERIAVCKRTGYIAEVMDALNHLGASQLQRGAIESAEATFEEGLQMTLEAPDMGIELQFRLRLTELQARLGDADAARQHLQRAVEIIGGQDWHGTMGRLRRAEATLLFAEGRAAEAEATMADAIEIFERYGLVWEEAEALHTWGRALGRGRGSRSRAVEKLDTALATYRERGAGARWAAAVEADRARITGGASVTYPDSLSEREVEVLRMIAAGHSNREIADELVLSVRTVERHIANLYDKAGLRNKAQATDYAHRHSLA